MLFVFRRMRVFQALLAIAALCLGIGCVFAVNAMVDDGDWWMLPVAGILGLAFFWLFTMALKTPTSYVAISDERTRIRFAGFVDTVVDNRDIVSARVVRFPLVGGLGVRTNFRGTVALTTAFGECAELKFRKPIRVWVIPKILPAKASTLVLSIKNPQKLADRFAGKGGAPATASAAPSLKPRRKSR
ncbi:MAG: hypothetical protein ACKVVT_18920 [Dehalococcoidia bacterium]